MEMTSSEVTLLIETLYYADGSPEIQALISRLRDYLSTLK